MLLRPEDAYLTPPLPGEYLWGEGWGLQGPASVSSLTQESCFMKDYNVCPCPHGGRSCEGAWAGHVETPRPRRVLSVSSALLGPREPGLALGGSAG